MDIVWMLVLETRSFTFRAVGTSAMQVAEALKKGWDVHCQQTGADPDYLKENVDSIEISPMRPGVCERDGSPLTEYAAYPVSVTPDVMAALEFLES